MAISKKYYKDPWNEKKVWEVVRMLSGYYLRQYIGGQQVNKDLKTTKKFIKSLGIFGFEEVATV